MDNTTNFAFLDSRPWIAVVSSGTKLAIFNRMAFLRSVNDSIRQILAAVQMGLLLFRLHWKAGYESYAGQA